MNRRTNRIIPHFFLWCFVYLALSGQKGCEPNDYRIELTGDQEEVLAPGEWGLDYTPDGHISYFLENGIYHLWFTGGNHAYHFEGTDFSDLYPSEIVNDMSIPSLGPSGIGFDRNYVGPGSVFRGSNGTDLLMVYHAEDWEFTEPGIIEAPYYASIGLARSKDGGIKWTREGQILTGRDVKPDTPTRMANGAGLPCIYVDEEGGFLYLYYIDWKTFQGTGSGPDEIHLARAPIESDGVPGSWRKYYRGGFSEPGLYGKSEAVIKRPSLSSRFVASASISFNTYLGSYIAVFYADDGFYSTMSDNGISWTTPVSFLSFPVAHTDLSIGDPWYIYPTLLSPDQDNDRMTSQTGYIYYAEGIFGVEKHHMVRRPFELMPSY